MTSQHLSIRGLESLLDLFKGSSRRIFRLIVELAGFPDRREHVAVTTQVLKNVTLEPQYIADRNIVELAGGATPHANDLLLYRVGRELALLE